MSDTIAAIATAPGRGAVGMVRVSGPQARNIAVQIAGQLPPARRASLREFRDDRGEVIDQGLLLLFPAPNSYTGEDLVELQAHGGPVVLSMLLEQAIKRGARQARPGEFSERAFLNERLDLAQAEAVADLIDAASRTAVRAAQRTLAGRFSQSIHALDSLLMDLRVYIEGALDFSDEDIDWLAEDALAEKISKASASLDQLIGQAQQGRRLRDGLSVAIVGKPNVGKSTLINALAACDAAIVSDIPGTTRDLLREHVLIDDVPINVVDTAGLRHTDDPIESEGIRRAWQAVEQADLALYLIEDAQAPDAEDQAFVEQLAAKGQVMLLLTKSDRGDRPVGATRSGDRPALRLSARTGEGMEWLKQELLRVAGIGDSTESLFSARARHLAALQESRLALQSAIGFLQARQEAELAAEEVRRAQDALGEIHGRHSTEDLLGEVFSRFCIGK